MHRRVSTLDLSAPEDQLAWLLLRVIAQFSLCTEGTLIARVAYGGNSSSEGGSIASAARMPERLGNALRKLGELGLIRRAGEHIAITEEGLRASNCRPMAAPERRDPSVEASRLGSDTVEEIGHALSAALAQMSEAIAAMRKAETGEVRPKEMLPAGAREFPWASLRPDAEVITVNRDVAIACRGVGRIDGIAEGQEMKSGVSNHLMFDARRSERRWERHIGLLKTQGARVLADCGSRLKRLCIHRLGDYRWGGNGAPAAALAARMRPVAAIALASTTVCLRRLAHLAAICRTRAVVVGRWGRQVGARLQQVLARTEFVGLERTRLFIVVGALLAAGALVVAGGAALLSGGQAARASRFPVVWQLDRPNRPIFVTRTAGKRVWVKAISISGENISNETLTAVQAVLKPDQSNAEIKLSLSPTGDAGAQEIPPGANFTLSYAFPQAAAPGERVGISAEEFLATYGGMIFAFHYTQSGNETTRIEYLSPSTLGAQLAKIEGLAAH